MVLVAAAEDPILGIAALDATLSLAPPKRVGCRAGGGQQSEENSRADVLADGSQPRSLLEGCGANTAQRVPVA